MERTIGDLLKALKPRGFVVALVAYTATGEGDPIRASVSVGKTDLISDLNKMPKDRRAFFKIEEWNWESRSNPGYWYRSRRIVIGSTGPDEIEGRYVQEDYGRPIPEGTRPRYVQT